ncbi:MAG: DegT/DnrJ/EryC1/StrS family aminotransferase [Gammaproteobacteria bacterium]|nr:DegT/DnrJ/EryC1/StrS family aminotransferase [Gammaproteobacteria bacterium]
MIPRLKPDLTLKEILALFKSNRKDDIEQYELAFASLMGQSHAINFPYGRTGLIFLLKALGILNQEIICPAYTCVVVPHAIVKSGNEPVFVDSSDYDFNADWDQIEQATTDKTAALIVTSIFGHPANLDKLAEYKKRHPSVIILQDCAHSYAASWNGMSVQRAGVAAIFGSNISKIITSINGGMVTTDDAELAKKLIQLRQEHVTPPTLLNDIKRRVYLFAVWIAFSETVYGFVNAMERAGFLNKLTRYYDENLINMPNDFLLGATATQGRVGKIQCQRYNKIIADRRKIAIYYHDHLQGIGDFILPPMITGATYSHYVIRTAHRNELMSYALNHGIQLGQLIEYCIPEMAAYKHRPGSRIPCPVASSMARETINLPISIGGSIKKAAKIVKVLKSYASIQDEKSNPCLQAQ